MKTRSESLTKTKKPLPKTLQKNLGSKLPKKKLDSSTPKKAGSTLPQKTASKKQDGWSKVETVKKYFKYSECKPGQILVKCGVYIGDSPNQFGRENHDFREEDGTIVCLNAAGQLDYVLQNNVSKGDTVRIIYAGTNTLTKGRYKNKEAHNFEVHLKDNDEQEDSEEELDEVNVGSLKKNGRAQHMEEESEDEDQEDSEELEEEESDEEEDLDLEDLEG